MTMLPGREGRHRELFDIDQEELAVDRSIEHAGRIDPVVSERRHEGQCFPFAERSLDDQLVAATAPAWQRGHVGLGPGLIDDNQFPGIESALIRLPPHPSPGDLRTILLAGEKAFLKLWPACWKSTAMSRQPCTVLSRGRPPDRGSLQGGRRPTLLAWKDKYVSYNMFIA